MFIKTLVKERRFDLPDNATEDAAVWDIVKALIEEHLTQARRKIKIKVSGYNINLDLVNLSA